MKPKIKVLLAVPELEDLGVQHVLLSLMRHWDRERFEPTMLLHKRTGAFADQFPTEFSSIQVDERIVDIRGARIALRLWGYARIFREVRPDAVISLVPYSNLACAWGRALSGVDFGLAVSEHAHVTASMQDTEALTGPFFWVYRRAFPRVYNQQADLVTCVAEESRRDLVENHGIVASRTRLIHETADFDEVRSSGRLAADHPWFEDSERAKIPIIVNVGRLCSQKRQDVLLRAFAILRGKRRVRLAFVGRGDHLTRLEAMASSLGVRDDVVFLGFQKNPWRFMAHSDLLAVASDWEGLPCVIAEAMALSIPVVSTRCPSGPAEMLMDGEAGLLCRVGDPDDLARAILETLDDPVATGRRVATATEHLQRFDPRKVTRDYEALADELASIGQKRRGAVDAK